MAENYVLLETIQLTQSAASVTFDNIPQSGYTDLKIVMSARMSGYAQIAGVLRFGFNGGSANQSVTTREIVGTGSGVGSSTTEYPVVNGGSSTSNVFNNLEVYIPNYTSNTNKSFSVDSVIENNATTAYQRLNACLWSNTAAITSIALSSDGNFDANSTFSLYGVAAFGTTPTVAPKATGGNIVANDGTYWYHAFLTSGTFTPQTNLTCDYLVVAGGGGGGCDNGGGGGAGGLRGATAQSLTTTSYSITVGAGGAKSTSGAALASSGTNSSFGSFAATGGGGGSSLSSNPNTARNGGSGGGSAAGYLQRPATGGSGNAGGYTPVEGYAGGSAGTSTWLGGCGGGGAAAAGSAQPSNANGGAGGVGSAAYSSWGAATNTGQLVSSTRYYAGGGGGGADAATGGAGGFGGGAPGANIGLSPSADATPNTGGGGGGGGGNNAAGVGSNGGSGIVIIRYAM